MIDLEEKLDGPIYLLINDERNCVVGHYDILKYARVRKSQLGRKGYTIYRVVTVSKVEVIDN